MCNVPSNIRQIGIKNAIFGENVSIVEPVNLYECIIGDGCFIGPFVEVQKNVRIGNRTKIQSHSFICEFVQIGEDCFVGHSVVFINDKFYDGKPAGGDHSLWEPTIVKDRVSIGSNATIMPVEICSDVVIGAGSVVTHSITRSGIYVGNPARFLRTVD